MAVQCTESLDNTENYFSILYAELRRKLILKSKL